MILRALAILALMPCLATGQETVDEAAHEARDAWMNHDVGRLLFGRDQVTLTLPRAESTRPLSPGQASSLMREFFRNTEELQFSYEKIGTGTDDQGYIEASRDFVIAGTTEIRTQKVIIGFRRISRVWRIFEIRIRGPGSSGG